MTLSHFHIFFHCTEKKTTIFFPKSFVLWWSFKFYFFIFFWLPFYNHFCYYIQIFHFGPIFCTKLLVIFVQSFSGKTKVNEVFLLRFLNKFFSLFFVFFWVALFYEMAWTFLNLFSLFISFFFFLFLSTKENSTFNLLTFNIIWQLSVFIYLFIS